MITNKFQKQYILIVIIILFILSGWEYLLLEKDLEDMNNTIKTTKEEYMNLRWSIVDSILTHSTMQAHLSVKKTSKQILDDIYTHYDNLDILKEKLYENSEEYDYEFGKILIDNIKDKYMNNIHNDRNNSFIMNDEGVIASYRLSSKYINLRESWNTNIKSSFNPTLTKNAINNIISQNLSDTVFWEITPPIKINDHQILRNPSISNLKNIFYNEGLKGLCNYTFLVPYYITPHGDMFGTLDYDPSSGKRNKNYKMIVVQKFNLHDIIMKFHISEFKELERNENIVIRKYEEMLRNKSWSTILTIFVQILIIILVISINRTIINNENK